ncbi:opioid growth factor receptor-like isoform X2 [Kryptolebias marmoratus]|uniref:opioid growth factor receptor-like isoform X2 n=1 Tax=Kryptolebias marmoratus TaxID=37003 RepID=UPI0007F91BE5|nr:opioid growth factor receptor-like isoform X2 [Kryptolebias marmoratus]
MKTMFRRATHKMFTCLKRLSDRMYRSKPFCWIRGIASWIWQTLCCIWSRFLAVGFLKRPALRQGPSVADYRVPPSDELFCDYDSTWEAEESQEEPRPVRRSSASTSYSIQYKFSRFKNAARDMHNYRHDYPSKHNQSWEQQSRDDMPNLKFYLGEQRCLPDGVYISEIHNNWRGDYYKLETVHTYIQWLFPLQEPGMNSRASTLTKQEIADFRRSDLAKENLLKSYKLMLDFYGIELEDETTGAVRRSARWEERFENLNRRTHNNLRITRILKCLGTLGYPHYQAPLVQFFLEQTLVHRQLPDVKESVLSYFMFAVLDRSERRKLVEFAYMNYTPKEEFVWCPKKIQRVWSRMQVEAPAAESDGDAEAGENKREELTDKTSFGGVVQSYPACRAFSEEV